VLRGLPRRIASANSCTWFALARITRQLKRQHLFTASSAALWCPYVCPSSIPRVGCSTTARQGLISRAGTYSQHKADHSKQRFRATQENASRERSRKRLTARPRGKKRARRKPPGKLSSQGPRGKRTCPCHAEPDVLARAWKAKNPVAFHPNRSSWKIAAAHRQIGPKKSPDSSWLHQSAANTDLQAQMSGELEQPAEQTPSLPTDQAMGEHSVRKTGPTAIPQRRPMTASA